MKKIKELIKQMEKELLQRGVNGCEYGRYLAFCTFLKFEKISPVEKLKRQKEKLGKLLEAAPLIWDTKSSDKILFGGLFYLLTSFLLYVKVK